MQGCLLRRIFIPRMLVLLSSLSLSMWIVRFTIEVRTSLSMLSLKPKKN
jgi:hypothetical protein